MARSPYSAQKAALLGNLLDAHILAEVVVIDVRLHLDQVDDPFEKGLCTDREEKAEEYREQMLEAISETDEGIMEKYISTTR